MSPIRAWWEAPVSELYLRAMRLESELSVAACLLELLQEERQSTHIAELLPKWRALIDETPEQQAEWRKRITAKSAAKDVAEEMAAQ